MKKSILILIALSALAACNTIAGAGKDIEHGGEAISDSAQKTKEKINAK